MSAKHAYVFAYDISDPKRARGIRKAITRWRIDGQYSVHETQLGQRDYEAVCAEMIELSDAQTDRALAAKLNSHKRSIYHLHHQPRRRSILGPAHRPAPQRWQDGCYLLSYDVRDRRRLQRVQRKIKSAVIPLQRSVFLFSGKGQALDTICEHVAAILDLAEDDCRVYHLRSPSDILFLQGPSPLGVLEKPQRVSPLKQMLLSSLLRRQRE